MEFLLFTLLFFATVTLSHQKDVAIKLKNGTLSYEDFKKAINKSRQLLSEPGVVVTIQIPPGVHQIQV